MDKREKSRINSQYYLNYYIKPLLKSLDLLYNNNIYPEAFDKAFLNSTDKV